MSDKTLVERLRDGSTANGTCTGAENGTCASVVIRNLLDKECESRYVCTTCRNCINETMNKIADAIEREYLPRQKADVLDADGVPITVGDVVYFVDNAEALYVLGIESDGDEPVHIGRKGRTSTDAWVSPGDLTHKQPDSLERIEEDALMASIDYCDKYGLLDSECNAEEGDEAVRHCTDCGLTCETRMVKHILLRQREVLERDHER